MTTRYRARCTEHQWAGPPRELSDEAGGDYDEHFDQEHGRKR